MRTTSRYSISRATFELAGRVLDWRAGYSNPFYYAPHSKIGPRASNHIVFVSRPKAEPKSPGPEGPDFWLERSFGPRYLANFLSLSLAEGQANSHLAFGQMLRACGLRPHAILSIYFGYELPEGQRIRICPKGKCSEHGPKDHAIHSIAK